MMLIIILIVVIVIFISIIIHLLVRRFFLTHLLRSLVSCLVALPSLIFASQLRGRSFSSLCLLYTSDAADDTPC
eukprot:96618-Pyramimonas_sp.AAC.1